MKRPSTLPGETVPELLERLKASEPVRVTGLGDSLTYGWMVQRGFFDRFIDKLRRAFPASPLSVTNAGIPGDTARGGEDRLHGLLTPPPTLVTIQFGLNDMYQGVDPLSFEQSLENIVKQVRGVGAIPVLVTSCPLNWNEGEKLAEIFYDRIRHVADRNNLPCADLDRYWRDNAGPRDQWAPMVQEDNLHPTDIGHELMADGLFACLVA
jgi:acyl-CoA thioesterase-1